jgi:hypothetical protein
MADVTIWTGTSTFFPGETPFGFYDSDTQFQADADKVASFCATRLGYPLMDVELQARSFYACFEEAVTTYGNEVFQYKVRENYLSMEGASSAGSFNNTLVQPSLDRVIQISQNYGTEAGVGGSIEKYSGLLQLSSSVQTYDLDAWATSQGITGGIEIVKVYYEAPPAILRYFDPYAGTGTGIQSLMDAFDFGSYSPGINFLLMPAYYDMLKVQAIEFNDQIRKSSYSFELIGNKLSILPVPRERLAIRIDYFKRSERTAAVSGSGAGLITNVGEVPYDNPTYTGINSVGRQWIYRYALALSKELLGYIRGKYQQVPVPGSNTTLNQADLLTDARTEKTELLTQLRDMLEQTSRRNQLERKANESEFIKTTLQSVPMTIFVG